MADSPKAQTIAELAGSDMDRIPDALEDAAKEEAILASEGKSESDESERPAEGETKDESAGDDKPEAEQVDATDDFEDFDSALQPPVEEPAAEKDDLDVVVDESTLSDEGKKVKATLEKQFKSAYTRKTQDLARIKKEHEAYAKLLSDPDVYAVAAKKLGAPQNGTPAPVATGDGDVDELLERLDPDSRKVLQRAIQKEQEKLVGPLKAEVEQMKQYYARMAEDVRVQKNAEELNRINSWAEKQSLPAIEGDVAEGMERLIRSNPNISNFDAYRLTVFGRVVGKKPVAAQAEKPKSRTEKSGVPSGAMQTTAKGKSIKQLWAEDSKKLRS